VAVEQLDAVKAIQWNNDVFQRNVQAQDAAALTEAFYAGEAVVMPQDHPPVSGKGPIVEFWNGMFKVGLRKADLETQQVESSGDQACEIGKYTLTFAAEGAEPTKAEGKYLVVLKRQQDGSWKVIADMFSGNG
jgi:ketosteroid isomerase-like protein